MASGVNYPISIYQGDTYTLSIVAKYSDGTRYNLSGYSGAAVIRSSYCATGTLGSFDVTFGNRASGEITISLTNVQTAALPSTIAFYDLEIASGSFVQKYLYGKMLIYPQLTSSFP